jgi:hypothetical protein
MSVRTNHYLIFLSSPSSTAGKRTELTVGSSEDVKEAQRRALAIRTERQILASKAKLSLTAAAKIAAAATVYGTPHERPSRTRTRPVYKSRRVAISAPGAWKGRRDNV